MPILVRIFSEIAALNLHVLLALLQAGKKGGKGQLEGKVISAHPSSVLLASSTRLAALARAGSATQHPPFVVFNGRLKTSRDYLTDGSVVYVEQAERCA